MSMSLHLGSSYPVLKQQHKTNLTKREKKEKVSLALGNYIEHWKTASPLSDFSMKEVWLMFISTSTLVIIKKTGDVF